MLKIGIVGLGVISQVHIKSILENEKAKLVALCDIDDKSFKNYKELENNCNFYSNLETMLDKEELDIVHITTPHFCHKSMIIKCVEKGVNVFTEKPAVLNYQEGLEVLKFMENKNAKVGVCLQNRYNHTTNILKEYVDNNLLGKPISIIGNVFWSRTKEYYESAPWRGQLELAGSGTLINQSIHTLDLMEYIVGPVKNIYGTAFNSILKNDIEVEDTATAILTFENGASGIFNSTIVYPTNRPVEIEINFEKGVLSFSNNKIILRQNNEDTQLYEPEPITSQKFYYGSNHFTCIDEFYNSVINNSNDYIDFSEGIKSIRLIDKILENRCYLK